MKTKTAMVRGGNITATDGLRARIIVVRPTMNAFILGAVVVASSATIPNRLSVMVKA